MNLWQRYVLKTTQFAQGNEQIKTFSHIKDLLISKKKLLI